MATQIPLPEPDAETAFFWEAAARGRLAILRCDECALFIHPPRPICRRCGSTKLSPSEVSGRGHVYSYTVTHQAVPGYEPPFTIVLVELVEQPGLRLISRITDVPPDDVRIGMAVEVAFEPVTEEVSLPLFKRAS